jgi:integrase
VEAVVPGSYDFVMPGHVVKTKSGRWMARFPLGVRGRFVSRTFDRKVAAERWLRERSDARDRGEMVDPNASRVQFSTVAEAFMKTRAAMVDNGNLALSTYARDESVMRQHVLPAWDSTQLRFITTERIKEWIADLSEDGLAPATVTKAVQLARMVLEEAVEERALPKNPFHSKRIKLPTPEKLDQHPFTIDEIYALADAIDPHYRALVFTGAMTGMRWGELGGLLRSSVDLEGGHITVERALGEVAGHTFLKNPKSNASKRRIAIDDELVRVLSGWFDERPVIGDGHVFTTPNGGHLRRSAFRSRIWRPALEAAGLPELHVFHDLRHTHAALLIEQGEHPLVIKERLGHASIQVTMDVYGHLFEGLDRDAATKLGSAFAATRKQQGRARQGSEVTEIWSGGQK